MYKIYTNWEDKQFIIKNDAEWIPMDPANTDYQEYLAWLEEGNIPEEWNPEAPQ